MTEQRERSTQGYGPAAGTGGRMAPDDPRRQGASPPCRPDRRPFDPIPEALARKREERQERLPQPPLPLER
jgi:hypothetical protein